jgi:hypothetical protein
MQSLMKMTIKVPPPLTWHICQIVVDYLFFVTTYVLNQSREQRLLSDAFDFAISMSLKLLKKIRKCIVFSNRNGRGFWCGT